MSDGHWTALRRSLRECLKECVTIRRELGGGWIHKENDDDVFENPNSLTAEMTKESIDAMEDELRNEIYGEGETSQ